MKNHDGCDLRLLNDFRDGELGGEERARVEKHLEKCGACKEKLREYDRISGIYKVGMDSTLSGTSFDGLEEAVMKQIRKKRVSLWDKFTDLFLSKRFLIPVSSMATVLIICLALFRHGYFSEEPTGPSAIVDSFTGDVTSVVIMETPESRQTIIWYSETPEIEEDDRNEV